MHTRNVIIEFNGLVLDKNLVACCTHVKVQYKDPLEVYSHHELFILLIMSEHD